MGQLKPNASYVYEKVNGVTYAREVGAPAADRFPIGWDFETQQALDQIKHDRLWDAIFKEAKTNPCLQDAIERVKIIYYLSKKHNNSPDWHPV